MRLQVLVSTAVRAIARVPKAMAWVAGGVTVLAAAFVLVDVITRRFLGFSTQGTTQYGGYMLAFAITWGLPYALTTKAHVRVDAVLMLLPLAPRASLHLVAIALMAVPVGAITYLAWGVALQSWELDARDATPLAVPMVIPQGLWALGFTVFFIVAVVYLIQAARLLWSRRYADLERLLHAGTSPVDAVAADLQDGAPPLVQ